MKEQRMARAAVLSGGGSRGAYQLGAWQALEEAGQRFDGFYGTSIGAINAALMAQDDLSLAGYLWDHISIEQVMADSTGMEINVQNILGNRRELLNFFRHFAQNHGADVTPLNNLCRSVIDEKRIRSLGKRLGVTAVKFPALTPVTMCLCNMEAGTLTDWLMASAACFPALAMWQMNGERYIDGGYYDNLPADMALLDGMDEIVAIDLHVKPCHPRLVKAPYVIYIRPSWPLGNILTFDQSVIQRNKRMGYLDAMKALGRLDGVKYAFYPVNRERLRRAARKFLLMMARTEAGISGQAPRTVGAAYPLSGILEERSDGRKMDDIDYLLRGCEVCAQMMNISAVEIYDEQRIFEQLNARVQAEPVIWNDTQPMKFLSGYQSKDRSAAIACLMDVISKRSSFEERELRAFCAWPNELIAAFYLLSRREQDAAN